jgi:hypothetical protein
VMQFGAKRCAQRARRGRARHDGRAKSAWAARTGLAGAPHSVQRSRVPTNNDNGRTKQGCFFQIPQLGPLEWFPKH